MLTSFFCTYDVGSPSYLGFGIVREVNPAIGVNIDLAIPFAFAVAFSLSLTFAFPFPVARFAARTSLATLATLAAPFPERREHILVGFFGGAFRRPLLLRCETMLLPTFSADAIVDTAILFSSHLWGLGSVVPLKTDDGSRVGYGRPRAVGTMEVLTSPLSAATLVSVRRR